MWDRKRRKEEAKVPKASRFDRLSQAALIDCLEAEMRRTAELFRGFSHTDIEQDWIVTQMLVHLETAKLATEALLRRVVGLQRD